MRGLIAFAVVLVALTVDVSQPALAGPPPAAKPAVPDGSHDFDFGLGTWKTHLRRLQHPLSGSSTWVEYDGTSIVRGVLQNRANIVELAVAGAAGRIEGAALRLYEPATHRWTLNFFNIADGQLTPPMIGGFHDGRGLFYGDDTLGTRPIKVRFEISPMTAGSYRFEQAFSADSGKTWEVNWIAVDTRGSEVVMALALPQHAGPEGPSFRLRHWSPSSGARPRSPRGCVASLSVDAALSTRRGALHFG